MYNYFKIESAKLKISEVLHQLNGDINQRKKLTSLILFFISITRLVAQKIVITIKLNTMVVIGLGKISSLMQFMNIKVYLCRAKIEY